MQRTEVRERRSENREQKKPVLSSLISLFLLISLLYSPLSPVPSVFASPTGGQPGKFVSWGAGARSLGMGRAFMAVADDASATYWNPAAMVRLDRKEVMALHTTLFADTNYNFLSYVHPTAKFGVFGANIVRLHSGGFERINIEVDPATQDIIRIENAGTFEDSRMAFTGAYGRRIRENISIGLAGKYISQSLADSHSGTVTFDLSTFVEGFNAILPELKLAFAIQNVISTSFGDTNDEMPLILKMGASHSLLKNRLLFAFDLEQSLTARMGWHLGTEYWLMNYLAVRLGFEGESGIRETTAGFGFRYKDYGIDYAFSLHDMGLSHRISGSWKIGESITANRTAVVSRLMEEAIESYRKGELLLSYSRLERILEIDPANRDAQTKSGKLQVVIGHIDTVVGDTEVAVAIRRGIASYVEGDDTAAVNALRYAYHKDPENMKLLALLNSIERELNVALTEAYKETLAGFTVIDQKVFDSRQAIIDGRYDRAIIKAQEILNLEPNNVIALEIMGSAFFMMDEHERAKEIWQKVLEIDPTNRVVPQFLNQLR